MEAAQPAKKEKRQTPLQQLRRQLCDQHEGVNNELYREAIGATSVFLDEVLAILRDPLCKKARKDVMRLCEQFNRALRMETLKDEEG